MLNAYVTGPTSLDVYNAIAFIRGQPKKFKQRPTMNQAYLNGRVGEGVQISLDLQLSINVDFQRRRGMIRPLP